MDYIRRLQLLQNQTSLQELRHSLPHNLHCSIRLSKSLFLRTWKHSLSISVAQKLSLLVTMQIWNQLCESPFGDYWIPIPCSPPFREAADNVRRASHRAFAVPG